MSRPLLISLLVWILAGSCTPALADGPFELPADGLLIITAAQDSTLAFRWEEGPGPAQLTLVWPEGRLIIPSDLAMQGDAEGDLGIPLLAGFGGTGPEGAVVLNEGIQPIAGSLAFSDGRLHWVVSGGELEIRGTRLIYRRPWVGEDGSAGQSLRDQRANLLMIAGLLLLIAVLLRRARRKNRRKD